MYVKCKKCQESFNSPPSRLKIGKGQFCSRECYSSFSKKECYCLSCGKKYLNHKSQAGDKFCCWKCFIKKVGTRIKRKCKSCGKTFMERKIRITRDKRGIYCSKECSSNGKKIDPIQRKKNQREYNKKYRAKNHDWYIAIKQKRRAKQSTFGGKFSAQEWQELKKKHKHICFNCNKKEPEIKLTIDHIIPLAKWGEWLKINNPSYKWNDIKNIQPLCGRCNSRKWIKTKSELYGNIERETRSGFSASQEVIKVTDC